jgi:hypothetical protein
MTNLFQIASDQAKAYRDQILKARQPDYATSVEVVPLVLGPELVTRLASLLALPCGSIRGRATDDHRAG